MGAKHSLSKRRFTLLSLEKQIMYLLLHKQSLMAAEIIHIYRGGKRQVERTLT